MPPKNQQGGGGIAQWLGLKIEPSMVPGWSPKSITNPKSDNPKAQQGSEPAGEVEPSSPITTALPGGRLGAPGSGSPRTRPQPPAARLHGRGAGSSGSVGVSGGLAADSQNRLWLWGCCQSRDKAHRVLEWTPQRWPLAHTPAAWLGLGALKAPLCPGSSGQAGHCALAPAVCSARPWTPLRSLWVLALGWPVPCGRNQ